MGVQPTIAIAAALGRGEPAVRSRARKLGLRVGTARGWPILRVARTVGISEYILRAYIRRGELPAFKGAKHVYLDPADLVVVTEIDWQHPSIEFEAAALQSLRQRLVILLTDRSGRQHRPMLPLGGWLVTTPARSFGSAPPPVTRTDCRRAELTAAA